MAEEREEHHHHHHDGGDGNAGVYAILIIIVLLILGAVLYFGGVFRPAGTDEPDFEADVRIEEEVPDVNVEPPDVDLPDTVRIQQE